MASESVDYVACALCGSRTCMSEDDCHLMWDPGHLRNFLDERDERIETLEAENARLRESESFWRVTARQTAEQLACLRKELEALRGRKVLSEGWWTDDPTLGWTPVSTDGPAYHAGAAIYARLIACQVPSNGQ